MHPESGNVNTATHEEVVDPENADRRFAAEMTGHAAPLRAYARRLAREGTDADDLMQDTMLRCWAARSRFEPGSNFAAWARRVMLNRFLSGRRRARFQADLPDDAPAGLLVAKATQELAIDLRDVGWALTELSPEHRAAIVLMGEGLSVEEAATRLSIPEGTFKSRLSRGRSRLRELTEDREASMPAPPMVVRPMRPDVPRRRPNWKGVMIG